MSPSASSAIGLVLSGGGAFGAWETGALHAFFDWWRSTRGEEPPIGVAVGTSTGALISPFALLGKRAEHDYLAEIIHTYGTVTSHQLRVERLALGEPAFLFLTSAPSVYDPGYSPTTPRHLYQLLQKMLPPDRVALLGSLWDEGKRLGAATLDFTLGRPHVVTNSPEDIESLIDGIFASAMAPLALPAIPLTAGDEDQPGTPHMDGGLYEEMPVRTLLELAAVDPPIELTHVVAISSFPWFPSDDSDPVQPDPFPDEPKFGSVGDRMNALMSEASATKDTRLAWAAVELRRAGLSESEVSDITGHAVPTPFELIRLFPRKRLGWQAFEFDPRQMKAMQRRGCEEAAATLGHILDCGSLP